MKIKIAENGLYKITYNQLQSLNFLTDNPNPKNFAIFFQGKEIPLLISGEADGTFGTGDYILFLGKRNDGALDKVLYSNPLHQPNPEVSLFEDEASYFLTFSPSTAGKRYNPIAPTATGLDSDPFIIYTASSNFVEQYYPGEYLLDVMSLSEYIDAEGYMGQSIEKGASVVKQLSTPQKVTTNLFQPIAEFYVAGRSNGVSNSGNNHHLNVSLGSTVIKDTLYTAYKAIRSKVNVSLSDITTNTQFTFKGINDLGAAADLQAPAYARLTYPRSLDMTGIPFISFKVKASSGDIVMKLSAKTSAAGNVLKFSNSNWQSPILLDTAANYIYRGTVNGSTTDFVINNPGSAAVFAGDENLAKATTVESVSFSLIDPATFNSNLLIVTHKSLAESSAEFVSYKTQKGFKPHLITTEELYNQFSFGVHHPLAIRNFVRYVLNKAAIKPEYLLLIGKGYETPKFLLAQDLVPTMGYPASDAAFSSQIIDNNLAPALATGRIPAKTNTEVRDYLDKVKMFDNFPDSIYRKNFIHVTGGKDIYENSTFVSYLKAHGDIARTNGVQVTNYNKRVTDAVTENLTEKIIASVNKGADMLAFFGHGSIGATEVSLSAPSNYASGKVTFFLINGCSTANAFTSAASMGEAFLLQKDKGAIGWVGTSSEGVASYLNSFTNLLYRYSFINNYGASISKNMLKATRDFQSNTDFSLNRAHTRQYMYLGDPTLSLYSPAKPDLEVKSSDIFISTQNITAKSEKIKVGIIIRNIGKVAGTNTMPVSVTRTLADGSIINYPSQNFPIVAHTDTIFYEMDNIGINAAGNNTFTIKIDPSNSISELNKANNIASSNFNIPSNGVTIISPAQFAIQGNTTLTLKVQQSNLLQKNSEYLFEIDTVSTFNSAWKKSSPIITADLFAVWQPSVTMEAEKVYYWRARLNLSENDGGTWKSSSFTFIPDSPIGWAQGHYQQFENISFDRMQFTADKKAFKYTNTSYPILVRTRGDQAPGSLSERAIRVGISVGKLSFNTDNFEGVSLVALHPVKQSVVFSYPSSYNFRNNGGSVYTGQFYFNTNDPVQADSLVRYINNIPQGYFVIGFSGVNFNPKALPVNVQTALNSLGLSSFTSVGLGEPYAFSGIKGAAPGTANEFLPDYTSATDPRQQMVSSNFTLPYPFSAGSFISEKIGPSVTWNSASIDVKTTTSDLVSFDIIGVDATGIETTLFANINASNNTGTVDLTNVSTEDYPYIRLKVNTSDNDFFTPAQLGLWKVLFDPYPEVTINTEVANISNLSTIARGDSIKLDLGVSNLDKYPTDSIDVVFEITKHDRTKISGNIATLAPLAGNSSTSFKFSYPTISLVDSTVLQVYIQPRNSKDRIALNNRIAYNFFVMPDNKEPLVDVLFDGRRIMNGEIVSPKPEIGITVLDDSKFMILNDTTSVEVYLKDPKGIESRVAFRSSKITMQNSGTAENNKVSYTFSPDLLADGVYTLRVKSKDKSGNSSSANDLNIDFEVVNEASITNFLPYPNPFTTSMQFVFKITGQKVPDKIKVQILTVTGKIVREVLKEELGTLQIGNNRSDFKWDGTDQFGDRLANGVYFYRVIVENNDKSEIKHRTSSSDAMFKKNYGKIYLMR